MTKPSSKNRKERQKRFKLAAQKELQKKGGKRPRNPSEAPVPMEGREDGGLEEMGMAGNQAQSPNLAAREGGNQPQTPSKGGKKRKGAGNPQQSPNVALEGREEKKGGKQLESPGAAAAKGRRKKKGKGKRQQSPCVVPEGGQENTGGNQPRSHGLAQEGGREKDGGNGADNPSAASEGGQEKNGNSLRGGRKRKGGGNQQQNANGPSKGQKQQNAKVSEESRNRIRLLLEQFHASNDADIQKLCSQNLSAFAVYTFGADLNNKERAVVHELCMKMRLKSKSSGGGNQRRVSVYKYSTKNKTLKHKDALMHIKFSTESGEILQDLFTHYPPDDSEVGEAIMGNCCEDTVRMWGNKNDTFCKPLLSKKEILKKVEALASKMKKGLIEVSDQRAKLPIASYGEAIASTVESHQVVLISGETGCGKTTQVPQFLLDHMWAKSTSCKVICTQPRRISATSVAERISYERGESVGDTVGYKIRLESKGGKHSSILFCTNGILLKVLVSKGNCTSKTDCATELTQGLLSEITHIIVDEIHERDRNSDFILAILRDALPLYPHLRLILMSATLDAERFSQYFGGCPIICVPGFTYPVKTYFLEDVLTILKSAEGNHLDSALAIEDSELSEKYKVALDEAIDLACTSDELDPLVDFVSLEGTPRIFNYQHSLTGVTPLMVFAGKGRVGNVCMLLSLGADCYLKAKDGTTALEWAEQEKQGEAAELIREDMKNALSTSKVEEELLNKYLATVNQELIDVALIDHLLRKICMDSKDGAVLIFLPGWDDINKTRERLLSVPFFRNSSKFLILPLHSMLPSTEQKKVFTRPPPGCRKIVLSTNIAETAVTIDDVVYVIDSGRMKEKNYDPHNNVSTLQSSWVSKANARQREGRAGRCQPGTCYHLFSKVQASSLPEFQIPEIKRTPIEEVCLQIKLLDPISEVEVFLRKLIDPPVSETIRNSIVVLQDIGAFSPDERLTEFGKILGGLPVHPLTGRMLLFAILLSCLDPALTLACASDYKDPFVIPVLLDEKKKATAAKAELASLYGGHSDQLAVIAAFDCWKSAKTKGQAAHFCSENFLSMSTMNMLSHMRQQLQKELVHNGFIPDLSNCSLNAKDPGILHAVLVAGLYPKVGRLHPPHRRGKRLVVETEPGDRVLLHSHSSNFKLPIKKSDACPLVIYDEVIRGDSGLSIRNCTVIGPLLLLLFASEMVVATRKDIEEDDGDSGDNSSNEDEKEQGLNEVKRSGDQQGEEIMSSPDNTVMVVVDRWLSFESTALDVAQIYCLRERLSAAILFRVKHPREVLPAALGASIFAVACILSYDGLSGISLLSGSVDSLTTKVSAAKIGRSATGKREMPQNLYKFLKTLNLHHNSPYYLTAASLPEVKGKRTLHGTSSCAVQPPHALAGHGKDSCKPYGNRGNSFKR